MLVLIKKIKSNLHYRPTCVITLKHVTSDGAQMAVWWFASGVVDSGLIPSAVKLMNLMLVFTAFSLDVKH